MTPDEARLHAVLIAGGYHIVGERAGCHVWRHWTPCRAVRWGRRRRWA